MIQIKYVFWVIFLVIMQSGCSHYRDNRPIGNESIQDGQPDDQMTIEDPTDIPMADPQDSDSVNADKYRHKPWMTRDDFAFIAVKSFDRLLPGDVRSPIMVDIEYSSNQPELIRAVAAGLLRVGRDHRVVPGARIRKLDVAIALWRFLELADALPSATEIENTGIPNDLTASHAARKEIAACLAAELLNVEPDTRFQAGKIMSGNEILEAFEAFNRHLVLSQN